MPSRAIIEGILASVADPDLKQKLIRAFDEVVARNPRGSATIAATGTSVVVLHGLEGTPLPGEILVTPASDLGSAVSWWTESYTATSFTIVVDAAPGVAVTFGWQAIFAR